MFYKVFCKYNDYFSIFAAYNKKNMQQSNYIIEVQNVSKYFGEKVALDNINLNVKKGEFVTILARDTDYPF